MSVVCFGEILWDELPAGKEIGGAPFNVAADLKKSGIDVHLISGVGNDVLGKEALNALEKIGLSTDLVQVNDQATGLVLVQLDKVGTPSYEILGNRSWDHIYLTPELTQTLNEAEFLVFGTLIFRSSISSKTIRSLLNDFQGKCIVDVNFRKPFYSKDLTDEVLGYADILKINEEELNEISVWSGIQGEQKQVMQMLADLYSLEMVILTKGSDGSVLYKNGDFFEMEAVDVKVENTVGAGDAFLAGIIYCLINKKEPEEALFVASRMGAAAAASKGAIPEIDIADLLY